MATAPPARAQTTRANSPGNSAASGASSQPGKFAPFVFLHAGDTELGSPDLPGTAKRFYLLAERANKLAPAFVVIAGDLVHGGSVPAELEAFDAGLKKFNMPVHVIPGNHDDLGVFRARFGQDYYVFTVNNCDFICLNSNRLAAPAQPPGPGGSAKPAGPGAPAKSQWSWLEDALKESRRLERTHVFVVMHHPPRSFAVLMDLLAKCRVEAVFCGHLHTTGQEARDGCAVYWVSGSAKVRDANGLRYRVFKVYQDRIEQESVLLDEQVEKAGLTASVPASRPSR